MNNADALARHLSRLSCYHMSGYWVQRGKTFRCYGCGHQFALSELPKKRRKIEMWRAK